MKCKVFNSSKKELQKEVNDWLQNEKIHIMNVTQTENQGYITLTLFYEELKEIRKRKLDKIKKASH